MHDGHSDNRRTVSAITVIRRITVSWFFALLSNRRDAGVMAMRLNTTADSVRFTNAAPCRAW